MDKKRVSIMGCGWLGFPLAKRLVQLGYAVNGSTTTPEKLEPLAAAGIQPFLLSFSENTSKTDLAEFLDAQVLIFNIPPSKNNSGTSDYEQLFQKVLEAVPASVQQLIFVSSTSVYADVTREVTEVDAVASANSASLLLRCEYLAQQKEGLQATIIRFGGLMGGDRHPGRWLAGKIDIPHPQGPVNMIHLRDCVSLISEILQQEKWGYTFNACAPLHPARKDFYTAAAESLQLAPPTFAPSSFPEGKRINSDHIQQELGYSFTFPDPLACLASPAF